MAKKRVVDLTVEDVWAAAKAKIEALAAEQVAADIALVEAQRAYDAAQYVLRAAQSRKTTAEKKLAQYRAQLGAE